MIRPKKPARSEPPIQLYRYIPRQVRLSGAGRALAVLIVALLAGAPALGIFLYLLGERQRAHRAELDREGVTIAAQVVEVGRTRGENRRRFAVYRYSIDGETFQGRATFRKGDSRALDVGSSLPVRVLPGEPGASWLEGREPGGVPTWVAFLAPMSLIFSAFLLWCPLQRQRKLLAEGRPAEGRVVGSKPAQSQHQSGYEVEYEFRVLSGATRTVKLQSQKKPELGKIVTMIYDVDNPNRSAVYPLCLVRLVER